MIQNSSQLDSYLEDIHQLTLSLILWARILSSNNLFVTVSLSFSLPSLTLLITFWGYCDALLTVCVKQYDIVDCTHAHTHTPTHTSCLRRVTAWGNTASRRRRGEVESQRAASRHTYTHNLTDARTDCRGKGELTWTSLIKAARSAIG